MRQSHSRNRPAPALIAVCVLMAATAPGVQAQGARPPAAQAQPGTPPDRGGEASPAPSPSKPAPDANDPASRAQLIEELYGQLSKAPDEPTSEKIVQAIERLWAISGSPTADVLMARAIAAVSAQRTDLALKFLDAVTELQPEWVDGFNRRAFLYVMKQDYGRALGDLRRVLALDPGNFRALEGLVQILRAMEQKKAALDAARQLRKAHPFSQGIADTVKELEREVEGQGI